MLTHGRVPSLVLTAQDLLDYRHQTVGVDGWESAIDVLPVRVSGCRGRSSARSWCSSWTSWGCSRAAGLPQFSGAAVEEVPWDIAVTLFEVR
jgi:hypothetical protein